MSRFSDFFPSSRGGGGTGITGGNNRTVNGVTYTNIVDHPSDPLFYPAMHNSQATSRTALTARGTVCNGTFWSGVGTNSQIMLPQFYTNNAVNAGGSDFTMTTAGAYQTAFTYTFTNGGFLLHTSGPRFAAGASVRMRLTVDGTQYEYIYTTAGGGSLGTRMHTGYLLPFTSRGEASTGERNLIPAVPTIQGPVTFTDDTTNNVLAAPTRPVEVAGGGSTNSALQVETASGRLVYYVPPQYTYIRNQYPKLYFSSTLTIEYWVDTITAAGEGARCSALVHEIV